MSCSGLHCPGCSSGQSLGVLAGTGCVLLIAYETVAIVAEYIWWIAGTLAVCFALAVAAGMWLERLSDRRAARWGAARGIRSRADVLLVDPVRAIAAEPRRREVAAPQAIVNHYGPEIHVYGRDGEEAAARTIRQALEDGNRHNHRWPADPGPMQEGR